MKANLNRKIRELYYYENGKKIIGAHSGITGDVSVIRGNVSVIWGDIDDCKISEKERLDGIDINKLIRN